MKRQVEIFTAGCPVCEPVVKLVEEAACDQCEITVYDLLKQYVPQCWLSLTTPGFLRDLAYHRL